MLNTRKQTGKARREVRSIDAEVMFHLLTSSSTSVHFRFRFDGRRNSSSAASSASVVLGSTDEFSISCMDTDSHSRLQSCAGRRLMILYSFPTSDSHISLPFPLISSFIRYSWPGLKTHSHSRKRCFFPFQFDVESRFNNHCVNNRRSNTGNIDNTHTHLVSTVQSQHTKLFSASSAGTSGR